jgi:hypothetical protein
MSRIVIVMLVYHCRRRRILTPCCLKTCSSFTWNTQSRAAKWNATHKNGNISQMQISERVGILFHSGHVACSFWTKETTNGTSLLRGLTIYSYFYTSLHFCFHSVLVFSNTSISIIPDQGRNLALPSNDMMWNLWSSVNYSQRLRTWTSFIRDKENLR